MKQDISPIIKNADITGWKTVEVEFGDKMLNIKVPPYCDELRMKPMPPIVSSKDEISNSLKNPIGSPPIPEIVKNKSMKLNKPIDKLTVCITVSDITRPAPYKGDSGILRPLMAIIEQAGIVRDNIVIVIGNGMHRPSTLEERLFMYGDDIVEKYKIVDHDCEDWSELVHAATTSRSTEVYLNKTFFNSDIKIITGLVESHFMTGISGGRKAVCPALVNTHTIQKFHSPEFLENPNATNLVLEGNPCHQEAVEVAQTVGVDFMISATLDHKLKITGVFGGDLLKAHAKAFEAMNEFVKIPVKESYDIVLTHAGYVGRNHYQSVKSAVGAMAIVKENGFIVMSANNCDVEPIGSPEYITLLHLFKILGPQGYLDILQHPSWVFTKDQWEPEMWGKPMFKVGTDGIIYCAPQISKMQYHLYIPGISGWDLLPDGVSFKTDRDITEAMLQNGIIYAAHHPKFEGRKPTMAFVVEGPYGIPMIEA